MRSLLGAAAFLATGLLAITAGRVLYQPRVLATAPRPGASVPAAAAFPGAAAQRRCAIYHARFGGTRAQLVVVIAVDVANYVVMEVASGARLPPSIPSAWLRAAFGAAETFWLGEFASPESALRRAASLCPESMRCLIGTPNCGPASLRSEAQSRKADPHDVR
jgi:hypothetical protein